jgi:hypothetical protein
MGRKRDQLATKKPKKAGGRAKKRQQDPMTFKENFKLNALKKRNYFLKFI